MIVDKSIISIWEGFMEHLMILNKKEVVFQKIYQHHFKSKYFLE